MKVGSFPVTSAHDVSGDVYAVNDKTLRIVNFNYDGKGPGNKYIEKYCILLQVQLCKEMSMKVSKYSDDLFHIHL